MDLLPARKRREGLYQTPSLVVNEGSRNMRRVAADHSIRKWYGDFSVVLCDLCVELFGINTDHAEKNW
jgi:hypothetical protein